MNNHQYTTLVKEAYYRLKDLSNLDEIFFEQLNDLRVYTNKYINEVKQIELYPNWKIKDQQTGSDSLEKLNLYKEQIIEICNEAKIEYHIYPLEPAYFKEELYIRLILKGNNLTNLIVLK